MASIQNDRERASIIAKIRALLAKTSENGATEPEALAAAKKAGELMERYRIGMTDVEIREEPVIELAVDRRNDVKGTGADYATLGIGRYCGVKYWSARSWDELLKRHRRRMIFFGLEADVQHARYLYKMFEGVVECEAEAFKKSAAYRASTSRRRATTAFEIGMGSRISKRLVRMAEEAEGRTTTASGTALVVIKNAIVEDAFAKRAIRLRSGRGPRISDAAAYRAGEDAGERVNLNRPLGQGHADMQALH